MTDDELDPDLRGWWRITETSQWIDETLDGLGPAVLSITGGGAPSCSRRETASAAMPTRYG